MTIYRTVIVSQKKSLNLEHNYRTAILIKVAECMKVLETSSEDFGVIITRHPATMNEYYTPEHILYESMKWAASPPDDDEALKKLWQRVRDEEKTFESMMADRLSRYNSLNRKILEGLKSKPWVKNELTKFGDFDEILRLYEQKRREHLKGTEIHFKKLMKGLNKEFSRLKDNNSKT